MYIPVSLRRLSYNSSIRKLVRTLHLEKIAKDYYLKLNRPADAPLRFERLGFVANFNVHKWRDVRLVEQIMFEPVLETLLKAVRPGDMVYDVGSSIGGYTVLLSQAVGALGRVISFEPSSEIYSELEQNVQLNRLDNVTCYRKALGNQNTTEKLFLGGGVGELKVATTQQVDEDDVYEVVEVVKGDDLVIRDGLPPPQVVKVDVEGFEFAVIEGLSRSLASRSCRLVCCEIHEQKLPAAVKPQMILDHLSSLGFTRQEFYPTRHEYHVFAHRPDGIERD